MTTKLYLIRHGIAADPFEYDSDSDRPLTAVGHQKTGKVAKRLQELDLHFDLILTSPLVRARQTAEILYRTNLSSHLEDSNQLAPGGNIHTWIKWLEAWQNSGGSQLALVGHQPDLGNWAEILVWGNAKAAIILKKAGIIGLNLPSSGSPIGNSELFWLTAPKLLL